MFKIYTVFSSRLIYRVVLIYRRCTASAFFHDVFVAEVSGKRRTNHPAVLATVPLHQHVALQPASAGTTPDAVHPSLGSEAASETQPH